MKPVVFSGCTGWVHAPTTAMPTGRGVVLCPSLGNEACNQHRALVMLGEALAAQGLTVLRIDYPGFGDSGWDEQDAVMPEMMITAIKDAAHWLRTTAGMQEIALCGLRLGALLAYEAARSLLGVTRLALLAPVASGRLFLREMLITARAWDAMWLVETTSEQDGWFEAHGVRLTLPAKKALEGLRLKGLHGPRMLVLSEDEMIKAALDDDAVEIHPFPEQANLLRDAMEVEIPYAAFARVAVWLAQDAPAQIADAPRYTVPLACVDLPGLSEHVVQEARFIGVKTVPTDTPVRMAALILNTGAHPHTGHSRCSVTLARRLARQGVLTLRIDVAGIGDAPVASGDRTDPYSDRNCAEARAALRWLRQDTGLAVMVIGMCSGAYAAVRLGVEPGVTGLVLVNLQKFFFDPSVPLRVVQNSTKRPTEFYKRGLRDWGTWKRILTGKVDVVGIGRVLAGRVVRRAYAAADPMLERIGIKTRYAVVRGWFRSLAARGVPVVYALSANDPGWDELAEYFGSGGAGLVALGNVRVHRLVNADHTLTHKPNRDDLFTQIDAALAESLKAIPVPETALAA